MRSRVRKRYEEITDSTKTLIKEYRSKEQDFYTDWGGRARIMHLLSTDIMSKFLKAESMFKNALDKKSNKDIVNCINMMQRAWTVITQELDDNGYQKIEPNIHCFEYGEQIILLTIFEHEVPAAAKKFGKDPGSVLSSIETLVRFIPQDFMEFLQTIQELDRSANFSKVKYLDKEK